MEVHNKSRLEVVTTHHQTLECKSQVDIQPPLRVINKRRAVPRTQSHGQISLAQSELLHLICGVPSSSLAKLKIIPAPAVLAKTFHIFLVFFYRMTTCTTQKCHLIEPFKKPY